MRQRITAAAAAERMRGAGGRTARGVAASGPVAALQALADRSPGVARLRGLGPGARAGGPLQRERDDVCNAAHFAEPVAFLAQMYPGHTLVEDGGSQGVESDLFQQKAGRMADPVTRGEIGDRLDRAYNRLARNPASSVPPMNKQLAALAEVIKAFGDVYDYRSALLFLRQNSKRMADAGLPIARIAQPGGNAPAPTHTFHRDAGLVTVAEGDLQGGGDARARRAAALNGPGQAGWVQGHHAIDNWSHRWVEHIHVDKEDSTNRFEIYNGPSSKVEAARKHGEDHAELLKGLSGGDKGAVETAFDRKKDEDLNRLAPE
ncbi:MAG: hypothetical protein ACXIU8_15900 [Alkalilacustris sp.]